MERYLVIIRSHLAEYVHHRKSGLHKLMATSPVQPDIYLCNTDELQRPPVPLPTRVMLNPEQEITLHLKPTRRLWPTPEPTRSVRANNGSTVKCQAVYLSSHRSVQQPPGRRRIRVQAQNPTRQLCSSRSETSPCAFTLTFTNADMSTWDTSQSPVMEGKRQHPIVRRLLKLNMLLRSE